MNNCEKYICKDCGRAFGETERSYGLCREHGVEAECGSCPECGSRETVAACECRVCGGAMEKPEDGIVLCEPCRCACVSFFELYLKKWFTREEVLYLDRVYDGKDLGAGIEGAFLDAV